MAGVAVVGGAAMFAGAVCGDGWIRNRLLSDRARRWPRIGLGIVLLHAATFLGWGFGGTLGVSVPLVLRDTTHFIAGLSVHASG